MYWLYFGTGAAALAVALSANRLGRLLGVIDRPDSIRKTHLHDTPLVGGIAIVVPLVAAAVYFGLNTDFTPFYGTFAAVVAGLLVLGFFDDRKHRRPSWRLAISAALCLAGLYAVPVLEVTFLRFSFLAKPLFLEGWSLLFTLLCLVGLLNAVNMADGKNGLVMGLTVLWLLLLMAYAPAHLVPLLTVFTICTAVVLVFNLRGHLFLGDSGAYSISVAVGLLAIYCYGIGFDRLTADVVALWFLIPVIDCLRLMISRLLKGRSPFSSDRNHLHHMMLLLMPWEWALAVYLALVGVPAVLAFVLPGWTLVWALLALTSYAIFFLAKLRSSTSQHQTVP